MRIRTCFVRKEPIPFPCLLDMITSHYILSHLCLVKSWWLE